jgi:succinate dehydrogenase / fumarate reductase, flavoprotein subunit
MMQDLVGIVRQQGEMERALDELRKLSDRAKKVGVVGNREFNPGWHTALDLHNLMIVSEAVTRSAIDRKESRGAHFRDDYPDKDAAAGKVTTVLKKGDGGEMQLRRDPLPDVPAELKQVIEEMK